MRAKRLFPDSSSLTSWLVVVLLIGQVILSTGIILKLKGLEEKYVQLFGMPNNVITPDIVPDVSIDDDPQKGPSTAPITIVEFADYQCPFCYEASKMVDNILADNKDKVRFVYRDFPLDSHPFAFQAAEAADCAGEQGRYWEMQTILFENQSNLTLMRMKDYAKQIGLNTHDFDACLDNEKYKDEVQHDFEEGKKYKVNGTPTFFVNGHRLVGPSQERLQSLIDQLTQ